METVANNPEDGQTEILFSHAKWRGSEKIIYAVV